MIRLSHAYFKPGAGHLELWDHLLPKYADRTLPGLAW